MSIRKMLGLSSLCAVACSVIPNAMRASDAALPQKPHLKARIDPISKVPREAGKLPGHGFVFVKSGMYKLDVNRTVVDFDRKMIDYDYYVYGKPRAQGRVELTSGIDDR